MSPPHPPSLDTRQQPHNGRSPRAREVLRDASCAPAPGRVASLGDGHPSTGARPDASPGDRPCGWCRRPLPGDQRRDAIYCTQSCRQAAHRAKIRPLEACPTDRPARLAYADPPYPGLAARYYADHPDFGGEVDHGELIRRLSRYDGWALSTNAESLGLVLDLSRDAGVKVRVAAWIRGGRPHPTARVVSSWEPLVYVPARSGARGSGDDGWTADSLVGPTPRRRSTLPTAVIGAKPPEFCAWLFRLLGAMPGDHLDDLFPGSGIVGRSWEWAQGRDPSRLATR